MKTCLNRLIGNCKNNCQRDYNITHHPNNYDCSDYYESNLLEFNVVKVNLIEKVYVKTREIIGRMFGKDGELNKKMLEEKAKELEKV